MASFARYLWPHNNWRWLAATFVVIVLDHAAKYAIAQTLPLYHSVHLLPWLNLTTMHNTGAAFSMFARAPALSFAVLAAAVSIAILVWLYRHPFAPQLQAAGFCLIMGGAIGNAIDRLVRGYVVDFIDFHIDDWHFAAFNLADSAITIGAALLILDAFFEYVRGGAKQHGD
ncbi:MAG TPA: signal peptidase II [Nevskiaceae bacterium]|nr:signal peptidase II [Nevskiaceae bacterium]